MNDLIQVPAGHYASLEGHMMRRETGRTPNGNPMSGRWVLRSPVGDLIDFDQFRIDLAERHGFRLVALPDDADTLPSGRR